MRPELTDDLEMDLWCWLLGQETLPQVISERWLARTIRARPWQKHRGCWYCTVGRARARYLADLRARYTRGYEDLMPSLD